MVQRPVPFAPDEWYHCFNRGVDKRVIFTSDKDSERFLMLLYACNSVEPIHISNIYQGKTLVKTLVDVLAATKRKETLVDIAAYCLMPNHIHLVLREKNDGGITSFMRKLGTGYTMYFNIKYERSGALFQGAFRAKHVATGAYFNRAISYVHANPAELVEPEWKQGVIRNEKKLRSFLSRYRYSSFLDYSEGLRPESVLISKAEAFDILDNPQTLEQLIEEAQIYARHDDDKFLPR